MGLLVILIDLIIFGLLLALGYTWWQALLILLVVEAGLYLIDKWVRG